MRPTDILLGATKAVAAQPLRTALILLAMSIGVAAVIILTSLGESARRYITGEFASLGTNLLIVLPGRNETTGGQPPLLGETPRDLTLEDALAMLRNRHVAGIAPVTVGSAPISWAGKERDVNVFGTTASLRTIRSLTLAQGRFLPEIDPQRALPVCVIGHKIKEEIFGRAQALGQWVRVGDRRVRVIGVLASEGQSIGVDFDENILVPVAFAQILFDSASLFRILVEIRTQETMTQGAEAIHKIIKARHEGEDDVTIITQNSVVDTFDKILNALTMTVASIAGISLAVAGILIMNVMLVSVSQRTAEIGLLKAIGAASRQLRLFFLSEAALLSLFGAGAGLLLGEIAVWLLQQLYPSFPLATPLWAYLASIGVALGTGLLFGLLPAIRAANMDPVEALSKR